LKSILYFLFRSAKDCQQQRPGVSFVQRKEADPEQLDSEYQAFLSDMGLQSTDSIKPEKSYVPPMGDLSKNFQTPKAPLMLTNGSCAPGAASAHARAMSNPQKAGGLRVSWVFLPVSSKGY
jgi:hypothetical protein